jgi:hypothetical protein
VAPPIVGAVMDVVVWLRSLGLGKYEAAFRENEIDETVLPSLTHGADPAARRPGVTLKLEKRRIESGPTQKVWESPIMLHGFA